MNNKYTSPSSLSVTFLLSCTIWQSPLFPVSPCRRRFVVPSWRRVSRGLTSCSIRWFPSQLQTSWGMGKPPSTPARSFQVCPSYSVTSSVSLRCVLDYGPWKLSVFSTPCMWPMTSSVRNTMSTRWLAKMSHTHTHTHTPTHTHVHTHTHTHTHTTLLEIWKLNDERFSRRLPSWNVCKISFLLSEVVKKENLSSFHFHRNNWEISLFNCACDYGKGDRFQRM